MITREQERPAKMCWIVHMKSIHSWDRACEIDMMAEHGQLFYRKQGGKRVH
jgi:hypothetical protein